MKNIEILKMMRPEFEFVVGENLLVIYEQGIEVTDSAVYQKIEDEYVAAAEGYSAILDTQKVKEAALARLGELDVLSLRPLRTILAGNGTETDKQRLKEFEEEAVFLRSNIKNHTI